MLAALAALSLVGSACSSPGHPKAASNSAPTSAVDPTTAVSSTSHPTTSTTAGAQAEQPGWTVASTTPLGIAVDERMIVTSSGSRVSILRFRKGKTLFNLHVGSTDPLIGSAVVPANGASSVSASERPQLVAAFNGGFKSTAGAGGFEVAGHTLLPLVNGEASLVIDTSGSASVGVWGQGVPAPGESVASVRQNLPPLIVAGQPSSAINVMYAWGATIGGASEVARSALGEDGQGNIVFAASSRAVPGDLSSAMMAVGVVNAMELDINPEWVQEDVASTPGGTLASVLANQNRPAGQYIEGWTRDFVTVLAAS
jgi:hypothetical protein